MNKYTRKKEKSLIGKLREYAAAVCQLILLEFVLRLAAKKISTVNTNNGNYSTKWEQLVDRYR